MSDGFEFDAGKNVTNRAKHGYLLEDFYGFDVDPAVTVDERREYGEARFRAFGRIGGRGYCLAYTFRDDKVRLISLRRAHEKEMRRHGR